MPLCVSGIVVMVVGLMLVPRRPPPNESYRSAFRAVVATGSFRYLVVPLVSAGLVALSAPAVIRDPDGR